MKLQDMKMQDIKMQDMTNISIVSTNPSNLAVLWKI